MAKRLKAGISGAALAVDTIALIYAGYLSAERRGQEVPVDTSGLSPVLETLVCA